MQDLYRSLAEHQEPMLAVIAAGWGLPLPEGESHEVAKTLGAQMLDPARFEAAYQGLDERAQLALAALQRAGGQVSARLLSLQFGTLERYGPARLERERPWEHPSSAVEQLYYRGWVYRGFGTIQGGYGEVIILPEQLQSLLPEPPRRTFADELEDAAPAPVLEGRNLAEDVLLALAQVRRRAPLAPGANDKLSLEDELAAVLAPRGSMLDAVGRQRQRLVWRLLWRLRLVEERRGRLQPTMIARDWLRLSDEARAHSLFVAWRDDPRLDELVQLPSLLCDEQGCKHDPTVPRRNLTRFLAEVPVEGWFTLGSVIAALRKHLAHFLRPDGDMTSWFIRDAETREFVSGMDSWDRVEGALARHLIRHHLCWLGLVEVAGQGEDEGLRLTSLGRLLFAGREPAVAPLPTGPLAVIGEDGVVTISRLNSAYERYQLERITVWEQDTAQVASYRITEDSVWQSQEAGIKTAQLASFLRRISGDKIPRSLEIAMQAWNGRFGHATLSETLLLKAHNPGAAREIGACRAIAPLLQRELAPGVWQVRPDDMDQLVSELKRLGMWPQIRRRE